MVTVMGVVVVAAVVVAAEEVVAGAGAGAGVDLCMRTCKQGGHKYQFIGLDRC